MVVLYGTGCPRCNVIEEKLRDKGVEYTDCRDVEEMKKLGIETVPVLKVDNKMYGFMDSIAWLRREENEGR